MSCIICEHAASDGFDKCPQCNRVFETCPMCGSKWLEKVSQNLPKADAYLLLGEVRAMKRQEEVRRPNSTADAFDEGYNFAIDEVLKKLASILLNIEE